MAKESVMIIDYGSGNLRSAAKAFERVVADHALDCEIFISAKAEDLRAASRVVLPGQGAFGDCMAGLSAVPDMVETLQEIVIKHARPFLGICVGMQLMADKGFEHGAHAGLGWIPGEVVPIAPQDPAFKIPHMGWNDLLPGRRNNHFVLRSADSSALEPPHYYFVHSFMFKCKDRHHLLAEVDYGGPIAAIIGRDNMLGVQFHPEKSQQDGLDLIARFLQWKP